MRSFLLLWHGQLGAERACALNYVQHKKQILPADPAPLSAPWNAGAHPWKLRGKKWNCPGGNHLTLLLGSENLQWVLVQKLLFCEEVQFLETLESAVLPRPSLHESEPMAASVSSQIFIVSGRTKRHLVQLHVFFNPLLSLYVCCFLKEKKYYFCNYWQ